MPEPRENVRLLAIDIGATAIKLAEIDVDGTPLEDPQRVVTPYPCTPTRLVDELTHVIRSRRCRRIGVGFPGDFADGRVLEPGNLSRSGGISTPIDPGVHRAWVGFDLQGALRARTDLDVRVVNDATLAALGCSEGVGRELVLTLGTGLGIALVVDGAPWRIRDVGAEVVRDGRTYDEVFGEPARAADEGRWQVLLHDTIANFVDEFAASVVHLGGGNARCVEVAGWADVDVRIVVHDNLASLRGAARLFVS